MKGDRFKGTVSECLAHPREILRPAIIHSAFAFALAHNHPSGATSPSEADLQLTRRIAAAARILQINFELLIEHPFADRNWVLAKELPEPPWFLLCTVDGQVLALHESQFRIVQ